MAVQPKVNKSWAAFLTAHPAPYTAAFALRGELPKGQTLLRLVQMSLATHATGKWATLSHREDKASLVLVALREKGDFDRLKAHHNGQAWKSTVVGAVDGFKVVLP